MKVSVWTLNEKEKIKTKREWTNGVTRSDRIGNKCIKISLGRSQWENEKWFGYVEKINNDETMEKIREMKVGGNRE